MVNPAQQKIVPGGVDTVLEEALKIEMKARK